MKVAFWVYWQEVESVSYPDDSADRLWSAEGFVFSLWSFLLFFSTLLEAHHNHLELRRSKIKHRTMFAVQAMAGNGKGAQVI